MDQRITEINQGTWIWYDRARSILDSLEDLVKYPRVTRMPNILIVGDTNNGKTEIVNKFYSSHKPQIIPGQDNLYVPVLKIEARPHWDSKSLYNTILSALRVRHKPNANIDLQYEQTLVALRRVKCKVLLIDEINQIIAGTPAKQRATLYSLKSLSNELKISIVGAGTKPALRVISTEPEIANRFKICHLDRWVLNKEFAELLLTFKQKFSSTDAKVNIDERFVRFVLDNSEGLLGEVASIMKLAAKHALINDRKTINYEDLEKIEWIKPSLRRANVY
jgi:hypothetical protein